MDEKAAPEKAARKIRHKTRRQFLEQCAAVGAAAATMSACKTMLGPREEKRRLNVLFLMTDQHRHNALGFRGDPYALTPNLDRLAASGTVFTHNYCQNPVCVPARVSILTGRYTHSTGTLTNDYGSDRTLPSFPQVLRANGYKAACFGKLHVSGRTDLVSMAESANSPAIAPTPAMPK